MKRELSIAALAVGLLTNGVAKADGELVSAPLPRQIRVLKSWKRNFPKEIHTWFQGGKPIPGGPANSDFSLQKGRCLVEMEQKQMPVVPASKTPLLADREAKYSRDNKVELQKMNFKGGSVRQHSVRWPVKPNSQGITGFTCIVPAFDAELKPRIPSEAELKEIFGAHIEIKLASSESPKTVAQAAQGISGAFAGRPDTAPTVESDTSRKEVVREATSAIPGSGTSDESAASKSGLK